MSLAKCAVTPTQHALLSGWAALWEKDVYGQPTAKTMAVLAAATERLRVIEKRKQQAALSALRGKEAVAVATGGRRAADSLLVRDYAGLNSGRIDVESAQHATRGHAQAKMADMMDLAASTKVADVERVSGDFARALAGKPIKDRRVAAAAKAWQDASEWLKTRFNDLGGDIKARADWLFPQRWDAEKIFPKGMDARAASKRWVDRIAPLYDTPGRMWPILGNDGQPIEGKQLRKWLHEAADSIRVGNVHGDIGTLPGAMKNRHADPRLIGFRDVEDRIAVASEFGDTNIFEVIDAHVSALSREIGAMQVLGPNPNHTYAKMRERLVSDGRGGLGTLDATFLSVTGALARPASMGLANVAAASRSFLSAALLPMSIVSQVSDTVPLSLTSTLFGIPMMRTLSEFTKALAPLVSSDRAALVRLGIDLDGFASQLEQAGVMDSASKTQWLASKTMQLNGTRKWAESGYIAMQKAILGKLADVSHLPLADADASMSGALSRYGWTEGQWDALRQHGIFEHQGARWASVGAIDDSSLSDAMKLDVNQRLIHTTQGGGRLAMTMPDARIRAAMAGGAQAGTVMGEVARSAMQFKSFGTQYVFNQLGVILSLSGGSRLAYGTGLFVGTAAMGMVAMQTKRLLKGQELADMTQHEVQVAAIMQGGGFGILGDLVGSAVKENRFGGGILTTLAGPTAGAMNDVVDLTFGNAGQAARGERANVASEAVRLAGRYTPMMNLPFIGLGAQRLVVDQLRLMADRTGTRRSFMTMEQKQRTDWNSGYWWRPGRLSPGGV